MPQSREKEEEQEEEEAEEEEEMWESGCDSSHPVSCCHLIINDSSILHFTVGREEAREVQHR